MSISICACNCKETSTGQSDDVTPVEIVDIDTLYDALGNQARAELNIGKKTTMFVSVDAIYSDFCKVKDVLKAVLYDGKDYYADVYLPKETLIGLEKGTYITITGIVDSVGELYSFGYGYTFKDAYIDDMALFDEHVRQEFSTFDSNEVVFDNSVFLIYYVKKRPDAFILTEEKIKDYLMGEWEFERTAQHYYNGALAYTSTHTAEITFELDGKYKYQSTSYPGVKNTIGEWYIADNEVYIKLFDYIGNVTCPVYKVTENIFIYKDKVFAKM